MKVNVLSAAISSVIYKQFAHGLAVLVSKDKYESLDVAIQVLYIQEGDDYVLDVDEKGYKDRIGEFRSTNIQTRKEIEELKKSAEKYKDLDPEKAREALAKIQELADQDMIDAGKLDELLDQRTERMKSDHAAQVEALTTSLDASNLRGNTAETELAKVVIDTKASEAANTVGTVAKGAMSDILSRARRVWKLQEGKPVALNTAGDPIFGSDGKAPLSFDEWAKGLVTEAPHLYEGSSGGGAKGNDGKGTKATEGVIDARDRSAFADNVEAIAKGERQATLS